MAKFDSKTWNPTVFEKYMKKVPNVKENSLIKNGLLDSKPNMTARLRDEVGGNYFVEPIKGLLDGQVLNYDGVVSMEATSRDTFEQGKIIIGRMKAWSEKDFSTELTGEDWTDLRYNHITAYEYGYIKTSPLVINLYHISWFVLAAFLLLNLVTGAILNNYQIVMEHSRKSELK